MCLRIVIYSPSMIVASCLAMIDTHRIAGDWSIDSIETGIDFMDAIPNTTYQHMRWTFGPGDTFLSTRGSVKSQIQGTYKLTKKENVGHLSITAEKEVSRFLYVISDDTIKLCRDMNSTDQAPPKFEANGKGTYIIILKRKMDKK